MDTKLIFIAVLIIVVGTAGAQDMKAKNVPVVVKTALVQKYPGAAKVSWEKEKGNYEANWGGISGEDNSVQFTPGGEFIEIVKAIPVSSLPAKVPGYVKAHCNGAKIKEAGKITDAAGKTMYEVEIKRKDLIFDERGNFLKTD